MRETGTVKFFNEEKGYGFIQRVGKPDIFVHFRSVIDDFKMLVKGQQVEFEIYQSKKGDQADKVTVIN